MSNLAESIKYQLVVMTEYLNKKPIEYASLEKPDLWIPCAKPTWNWQDFNYRVKKETQTLWQFVIKDDGNYYVTAKFYENVEQAKRDLKDSAYKLVKKAEWTKLEIED